MSFSNLSLNQSSLYFLKENNFSKATEIQKKAIPEILNNKSVLALAPTGTGKTLAFALPVMQKLKELEDEGVETEKAAPHAIVLSPTRELATQIFQIFKSISHHHKLRVRKLVGGTSAKDTGTLARSTFEVLIAGPSRLESAIKRKEISLKNCRFLVMDEADQLMDMGFQKQIQNVVNYCPEICQVALFSATVPTQVVDLMEKSFKHKNILKISTQDSHKISQKIETYSVQVAPGTKPQLALSFLKEKAKGQGIIFCNLKKNVEELFEFLKSKDQPRKIAMLHGGLEAKKRQQIFKDFKDKKVQVLVSSDISARGVDIANLSWVLNYDLPQTPLYYLHRAGRTGRMNKTGKVFNFISHAKRDQLNIQKINKCIKNELSFRIDEIDYLDSTLKLKAEASKLRKKSKRNSKKSASKSTITKKNPLKKKVKKTPRFARKKK